MRRVARLREGGGDRDGDGRLAAAAGSQVADADDLDGGFVRTGQGAFKAPGQRIGAAQRRQNPGPRPGA